MNTNELITNFWIWFEKNNQNYLFLNDVTEEEKDRLMDQLLMELHKYCDELYFEIGGHPEDETVDLVITAEGIIEHFPKVEQLIDLAPDLKDWRFIKFRPPHGSGFSTEYRGKNFKPDKIIFIPLNNKTDPSVVGIKVCYPDFSEDENDIFINGTYIMLDTLIGEKSTALNIDYLEVVMTPKDIADYNFLHLNDLEEYIKEKKGNIA